MGATAVLRAPARRAGAALALAVVLGVTSAACGLPAAGGGSGGGGVPPGGTLRIAIGAAEPELNILEYKNHSFDVLDQIYEPLVSYGADGKLQPALARSWQVSGDGLTKTFHLRRNVTFSGRHTVRCGGGQAGSGPPAGPEAAPVPRRVQ